MRFLTIVLLFVLVSCQNNPADSGAAQTGDSAVSPSDTSQKTGYAYTFNDTILVSLGAKDFAAVIKLKPNMPILDVRGDDEYNAGHIWRSVHMDASDKNFDYRIASFGRQQEYAVYCQSGSVSFRVAEKMKQMGFKRIYHLQKGLLNWGETGQALQLK
jgi:rhodanese-related sulfurtransferase